MMLLRGRCAAIAARRLSSSAVPAASSSAVDRLNATLERYPASSFTFHIGTSLGTFAVAYQLLHAFSFDAPSLAAAGVLCRLTKRLRTPVDMSIAAAIAHAFPWANRLKLGPLLSAPMQAQPAAAAAERSSVEKGLESALNWAQGPVNKYGGPYVMVHWATGISSMTLFATAVHYGVDVSQLLGSLPLIGSVSEASLQSASGTASCVAGGMLINTLTLPGRLYLLALHGLPTFELLGHHRARMLVKLRAQMRQDLRADPPRVSRRLRRHGESEGE